MTLVRFIKGDFPAEWRWWASLWYATVFIPAIAASALLGTGLAANLFLAAVTAPLHALGVVAITGLAVLLHWVPHG
jgi:hypothetical protein